MTPGAIKLSVALFVAPIIGTASAGVTHWLLYLRVVEDLPPALVIAALFGLAATLPMMLTVGMLAHTRLLRQRHSSALAYATTGGAIGAVFGGIVGFMTSPSSLPLALGLQIGGVSAAVFWLIRRPDRDAPPTSSRTREA